MSAKQRNIVSPIWNSRLIAGCPSYGNERAQVLLIDTMLAGAVLLDRSQSYHLAARAESAQCANGCSNAVRSLHKNASTNAADVWKFSSFLGRLL